MIIKFLNKNNDWHRFNGPALFDITGYILYSKNNKPHREDGPSIIYPNGEKYYFLNDKEYSEKEYNYKIKKRINLNRNINDKINIFK